MTGSGWFVLFLHISPQCSSEDSHVTFTLTFIHTPELAEGVARKGNSRPHAVIHPVHSPPVLRSCICSGPACSSDGSLQEPTLTLVLPSAPAWAAWPGGAEHNLRLLQLPPSAHPAASHLVPRSQACSRPSWEAEVIGSINQLN